MPVTLRMRCPNCGKWNNIKTEKVDLKLDTEMLKMDNFLPTYLPLKREVCQRCSREIANQKELIRIHPIDKKLFENLKSPVT
jgi:hypothetical protein